MGPPTPSTRSVQPMSWGATSCTLRAKNSRPSFTSALEELVVVARLGRRLEQLPGSAVEIGEVDASLARVLDDALGELYGVVEDLDAACVADTHLAEDRALGARSDDGLGDPLDPDARPTAVTAVAAGQRLERVDLVRARELAEPEEDHLGGAVSHDLIIAGTRPAPRRRVPGRPRRGVCETGERVTGGSCPRRPGTSLPSSRSAPASTAASGSTGDTASRRCLRRRASP